MLQTSYFNYLIMIRNWQHTVHWFKTTAGDCCSTTNSHQFANHSFKQLKKMTLKEKIQTIGWYSYMPPASGALIIKHGWKVSTFAMCSWQLRSSRYHRNNNALKSEIISGSKSQISYHKTAICASFKSIALIVRKFSSLFLWIKVLRLHATQVHTCLNTTTLPPCKIDILIWHHSKMPKAYIMKIKKEVFLASYQLIRLTMSEKVIK